MRMDQTIRLKVNGNEHELEIPAHRLLVDCLRYDLGLTGTKEGCSVGICGACTVLLDGKMIASCIALAVAADGAEITTIEGLVQNGQLHPLQQSFIDHGGFQCGICTPGQIMAAKALLQRDVPKRPAHPHTSQVCSGDDGADPSQTHGPGSINMHDSSVGKRTSQNLSPYHPWQNDVRGVYQFA